MSSGNYLLSGLALLLAGRLLFAHARHTGVEYYSGNPLKKPAEAMVKRWFGAR